jgi:hypothetical protein
MLSSPNDLVGKNVLEIFVLFSCSLNYFLLKKLNQQYKYGYRQWNGDQQDKKNKERRLAKLVVQPIPGFLFGGSIL